MSDVFDEPGNEELDLETMEVSEAPDATEEVQPVQSEQPEVVAEAEVTEDVEEAAVVAQVKEERPSETVPLATMLEERTARKGLQNEVGELKQKINTLSSLKDELDAMRNKDTQEQESQAFEEDPIAALKSQNEKTQQELNDYKDGNKATADQNEAVNQFQSAVMTQVEQFKAETPDYLDALSFVSEKVTGVYGTMGISDSDKSQAFDNWATDVAATALQNGINPGQAVYDIAKQFGYTIPKAPEDKITNIDKGQQASQSLSDTGGQGDSTTLSDIESMSDDEFDALWNDMERSN